MIDPTIDELRPMLIERLRMAATVIDEARVGIQPRRTSVRLTGALRDHADVLERMEVAE